MRHARAVALSAAVVLVAALGVLAARSGHREGGREALVPAAARPLPTYPRVVPTPTFTPPSSWTAGQPLPLPSWVQINVPSARVAPHCPATVRLPAPTSHVFVPEQGGDQTGLMIDGREAWVTFFGRSLADRDHTWLTGVDLGSGQTKTIDTLGANAVLAASGFGWGTRAAVGPDLLEADLVRGRVGRTWRWQDMGGFAPEYVAVTDRTAFLLEFAGEGASYLAGLDLASGTVKWQERLDNGEPSGYAPGRNVFLTTFNGDAYAVVPVLGSSVLHVYRVDPNGVVLARARLVGPGESTEPSLVADAEGVYLSTVRSGYPDLGAEILRLDPTTLALRASTTSLGYARLSIDGGAVLVDAVACNETLVSRLDGRTLRTYATYDVNPGNTQADFIAVSAGQLVVAYKQQFDDKRIIVDAYRIP